jgi:hypothetical protein
VVIAIVAVAVVIAVVAAVVVVLRRSFALERGVGA